MSSLKKIDEDVVMKDVAMKDVEKTKEQKTENRKEVEKNLENEKDTQKTVENVDFDAKKAKVEVEKKEKTLNEKIAEAEYNAMINTKEELMKTVQKRVELLVNGASNEELQANDDRKQILSRSIESYEQNKKNKRVNYQTQREIVIPDNLPALQFHPDTDKVKNKLVFDTIDEFIYHFQMVFFQKEKDLDDNWERFFISSVQHSMDKSQWYREKLMGKHFNWDQAKKMICNQYGGANTVPVYLQKLNQLQLSQWENPVHFTNKFLSLMKSARVTDSSGYGNMLLKRLQRHQLDLVKHIRSTHLSTPNRPELTATYVVEAVPYLYMEPDNTEPHTGDKRRARNNDHSHPKKVTAVNGRHGNNEKPQHKKFFNKHYNRYDNENSNDNKATCKDCHKPRGYKHWCQEFVDRRKKEKQTSLTARLAKLEEQINEQNIELAMRKIDLQRESECKLKSRAANDKRLTGISYVVPITIGSHKTFGLVDSGSNFSSIDYKFVKNKKISYDSSFGFISLAQAQHDAKRICTTHPIDIHYSGKEEKVRFEIMTYPTDEQYDCIIGTDLFARLGIFIVGLATSYNDKPALQFDDNETNDLPTPDDSPAGNKEEQLQFHKVIENSITANQNIDKKSFCTVPESIVTLDTPPGKTCYKRQYPIANTLMPIMDEAVLNWYKDGTIVKAGVNTSWNSPLTLAPKKDADGKKSKKRPCLDPRHLNLLLPDDKYPLPLIRDIFEKLRGATIFTTLDLKNAFHRFQIAPKDRHKTTFTHRNTQYMFQGCPFGLKPLSSKFQRVTSSLLNEMDFATSFIDDIVVYSKTIDEHAQHVKIVIEKLTSVNLILNPNKCHFAQRSVYLLGFCVSDKGLSLDTRKVTNVQSWPIPQTGNEIERFLGVINYFRDHIPKVSTLTAPLDKLRKEKRLGSKWDTLCFTAFTKLKYILTRTTVLKHPNMDHPFYVATDASNTGIGAVLFQLIDKKVQHIGFFARALSKSERNYSTTKRELLAIVFALHKFHKYLWGNHFTLFTDHRALTYIHTQKIANPMMITWLDTLLQYNFTVAHVPGLSNVLPDALSRLFPVEKELGGDDNLPNPRKITYKLHKMEKLMNRYTKINHEQEEWQQEYMVPEKRDRHQLIRMYHRKAAIYSEAHLNQPEEQTRTNIEELDKRNMLLERQHAFGHFGAEAMEKALHADGIHWPNLKKDAIDMVKKCHQCMQYNVVRKGYNPLASITAQLPGDHWAMDLAGEFEQTNRGNVYLLVMVDICTKFVIIKAIPDKQATTIAESLLDVFCTFGFPKILQSDNGTEFVNKIIKLMTRSTKIDHRLISAYHPRANGAAERTVQTVKHSIEKHIDGESKDWDYYIPPVQLAINAKIVRLTNSAPFALMFARKMNDFDDYSNIAVNNTTLQTGNGEVMQRIKDMADIVIPAIVQRTKEVREASQKQFNSTHKIIDYPTGSLVSILKPTRTSQIETKYNGPFTVVKKNKGGAYVLQQRNGELLDKTYPPSALKHVAVDPIIDNEDRWEVKAIISHRGEPGNYEYKVRWKGFEADDDTWEKADMFDDMDTIRTYWNKRQSASELVESNKKRKLRSSTRNRST